ncbi:alpha/beta hydrolase [Pseudonocardia tropica]|uniref:Alpha/beta hydrolase n=1 Tax=Pseudonocardia tropica TaxID=681289 RepID=A0ABV1K273_9PSEU
MTQAAGQLRAILDEVSADQLVRSAATRHRIEGAVLALDAALTPQGSRIAPLSPVRLGASVGTVGEDDGVNDASGDHRSTIDVDGCDLSIRITGSGRPAIVFLNSSGGDGSEWNHLRPLLPRDTTVVDYGRPGLAGSAPLSGGEAEREFGPRWAAEQLRGLLARAGVAPPYVLVSSSLGGWILSMYAATWPEELAGAVMVDPTMRTAWPDEVVRRPVIEDGNNGGIRFPMGRSFEELREAPASPVARCVVVSSSVGRWLRDPPENPFYEPLTLDQVDELWQDFQRDWARHLSAIQVVAHSAGHFVHKDAPELVSLVISEVCCASRGDLPLQLSSRDLDEAGGHLASQLG